MKRFNKKQTETLSPRPLREREQLYEQSELQMRERGEQNSFAKQTETCHAELVSASCNRYGDKTLKRVQGDKAAFTLAEVFHPAEQSKRTAFTLAEVFHPAEQSKRTAFTMAEVLITLGIIGVVAALTMPTLIMHHRKQVVETRLKKFYSMFNQAILLSIVENGEVSTWQYFNNDKYDEDGNVINQADKIDESFQKYLAPYMKIISKKAVNDRYNNKDNKRIVYYLEDGSAFSYAWHENRDIQFYPENAEKCIEKEYAQRAGNCHFEFFFEPLRNITANKYHYNRNLEPNKFNWDGSYNTLFNNCKEIGAFCTALIQHNGWKIPDNYPRKLK